MRRKSLIFNSILAVSILFGSLLYHSCTKDENIDKNESSELKDVDLVRINQIKQFSTDAKENKKSVEMMDANEALLLIEATFNYTYAWADYDYDEMITDTVFVDINLNGNQISANEAFNAYNTILEKLVGFYNNIEANEKKFVFVDLFFAENSELPVLIAEAGFGTKSNLKSAKTVDTDDWWYWGHEHGKCGNYSGTEGDIKDAADLIKTEVYNILHTPMAGYYWESYTTKNMIATQHPAPAGSDWDYLIFYWGASGNWMWRPEPCLSPTDITFFIDGYINIVEDYEAQYNKQFANFMTYYDNEYFEPQNGAWYTWKKHEGQIKLAIKKKKKPNEEVPTEFGL